MERFGGNHEKKKASNMVRMGLAALAAISPVIGTTKTEAGILNHTDAYYEVVGGRSNDAANSINDFGVDQTVTSLSVDQFQHIQTVIANYEANHPSHDGADQKTIIKIEKEGGDARIIARVLAYDSLAELENAVKQSTDLSEPVRKIVLDEIHVRKTMQREENRTAHINIKQERAANYLTNPDQVHEGR